MGFNPKYSQWRSENWQGYAPTIGDMANKEWNLTAQCWTCRLEMAVDAQRVIRATGPKWSPWGKSARCRRLGCTGRMKLKAYAPGPGCYVDI